MLHTIKPQFEKLIVPICRVFEKYRISPNWITVLGLLFIVGGSISIGLKQFYAAFILILIGGVLDGVDGKVARDLGMATKFGAFLDSTLDRFSEVAVGVGLLFCFYGSRTFPLMALLLFLGISGTMLTSYTRARGDAAGYDAKGGIFQRADRGAVFFVFMLAGRIVDGAKGLEDFEYTLYSMMVGMAIVVFVSFITVFQRIYLVWKGLKGKV